MGVIPGVMRCKCCGSGVCPACIYVDASGITVCTNPCFNHPTAGDNSNFSFDGDLSGSGELVGPTSGVCAYQTATENGTLTVYPSTNGSCTGSPTTGNVGFLCVVNIDEAAGTVLCASIRDLGGRRVIFNSGPITAPLGSTISNALTLADCGTLIAGTCGSAGLNAVVMGYGGSLIVTDISGGCSFCKCVLPPCTPVGSTPLAMIRATTSGIAVSLDTCVIGSGSINNFKLTGTTAANRTIDLVQDATNKCKWEASVACDWVLRRYANAANCAASLSATGTWNITALKYTLIRTSATVWSWEVAGYDGATKRVSIVGTNPGSCGFAALTSTATSGDCKTITAPTHLSRTSCVAEAGPTGIFGSAGATSFSACL